MGVISMPSVSLGWHHPLTDCGFRTGFTMGYSQRKWDRVGWRGGAGIWFHLLFTNPPSSPSACFVSGSHCWACIPHPVCFFLYLFLLNNRKWEFRRCLRCFFLCVFFPLTNQIWSPASILKMLSAFASLHFAAIIFNIPIITQCYPHSQWLSLHAFQQISKNFPWSPASKTAALCHIHMEIASTETYTPTHSYCQQTVN